MSAVKRTRSWHLAPLPALIGMGALLLALVAASTGVGSRLLGSTKADFTLSASPSSASTQQGQTVSYMLTEQKLNGFSSPVTLAVTSRLPAGATAAFSPQTLDTKTTSTLTIIVGSTTPTGTYTVTVTGTGGGLSRSTSVSLTVTSAPASPGFSLSVSPSSQSMLPGGTAQYTVSTAALNGFTGSVSFGLSGAPAGATSTFNPASVAVGGSSTLQVATTSSTSGGTYTLVISGTSGTKQVSTSASLVIATSGKTFSISSPAVTVPGPGAAVPLNLSLYNPNNQALQVTNLTVSVAGVTKASSASPSLACTTGDYSVVQYSGSYPLSVAPGQTVSLLTLLGSPSAAPLPRLVMRNSSTNQDGCKGATVQLSFSGTGQGS